MCDCLSDHSNDCFRIACNSNKKGSDAESDADDNSSDYSCRAERRGIHSTSVKSFVHFCFVVVVGHTYCTWLNLPSLAQRLVIGEGWLYQLCSLSLSLSLSLSIYIYIYSLLSLVAV